MTDIRFSGVNYDHLLPSQSEMAQIDKDTIGDKVSSLELMERAALSVADSLMPYLTEGSAVILSGPGNNGGDGLAAARILHTRSKSVSCIISESSKYSEDFLHQISLCKESKVNLFSLNEVSELSTKRLDKDDCSKCLNDCTLIIDCLLGTGQNEAPRGGVLDLLKLVPKEKSDNRFLIAVDIPTGINGNTGEVYQDAFLADMTICIELVKRGLVQYPARLNAGMLICKTIGLKLDAKSAKFSVNTPEVPASIKSRNPASHKGSFGKVLSIGGSKEMPGAPILASHAALLSGAGLVKLIDIGEFENLTIPSELIKVCLEESACYNEDHIEKTLQEIDIADSISIGFGIGLKNSSKNFVNSCIEHSIKTKKKLVIDADALTFLSQNQELLSMLDENTVLTPHPGEMARLIGIDTAEVQRDRYSAVEALREKTGAVVVLKGASTIVFGSDFGVVNLSGTPYMASPGSGDVLAGIISAYLAQGLNAFTAASLAVYIHGLAGERAASALEDTPILASELISHIRSAFATYRDSYEQ